MVCANCGSTFWEGASAEGDPTRDCGWTRRSGGARYIVGQRARLAGKRSPKRAQLEPKIKLAEQAVAHRITSLHISQAVGRCGAGTPARHSCLPRRDSLLYPMAVYTV
jgi:hypothetical protein